MFLQPIYLFAILLTVGINYILPQSKRYIFLLLVSFLIIASFNPASLITLLVLSGINYMLIHQLHHSKNDIYYYLGLVLNCSAILLFNYFTSANHQLKFSLNPVYFDMKALILALGLSFYSIQHIAYLIDVRKQRIVPEKNFTKHLFTIAFFPKIISGPVTTMQELLPQTQDKIISKEQLYGGFNRFLIGIVKKMVMADRLAPAVASVFDHNDSYPGITSLIGAMLFTIQLYFDFSGYADMALGTSKMLGFELKENFQLPFRSASVSEFWRRWHITLIRFFTTYIYYPVTYKLRRLKQTAAYLGIIVTFLISGLWHGIAFGFICWALCHVVYICFELATKNIRSNFFKPSFPVVTRYLGITITFVAVSFSNIFFRSISFASAQQHLKNIFTQFFPNDWTADVMAPIAVGGQQAEYFNLIVTLTLCTAFLLFERKIESISRKEELNLKYVFISLILITLFGVFNSGERFIYMQF